MKTRYGIKPCLVLSHIVCLGVARFHVRFSFTTTFTARVSSKRSAFWRGDRQSLYISL